MIRWQATITYRTDAGPNEVVHYLEEIEDLHHLVERGPHWDTITHIEIVRTNAGSLAASLTVEEAAKL